MDTIMNIIINSRYPDPNWAKINELVNQGYIKEEKHPEVDLWIYNYTDKTQREKNWCLESLISRGLIVNSDRQIQARPFIKFFGFEQWESPIPDGTYRVYDKLDGSLGISYWIDDEMYIATRGSFVSPQTYKAKEILNTMDYQFDPNITYMFEIIYPENRIIVDYKGEEKLVLLAAINTITGEEFELQQFEYPFEKARTYEIDDLDSLKKYEDPNSEGFVVRWDNGFRLKFKFEEYLRLNKMMKGVSKKRIWELLKEGKDINHFMDDVPDEFYSSINNWKEEIEHNFLELDHKIQNEYNQLDIALEKKELADIVLKEHKEIAPALFQIINGKDYRPYIWRSIQPKERY